MVTLKKGNKGEEVKALQKLLGVTVDGDFGVKTEAAVKAFQKTHKDKQGNQLVSDGIVGKKTWEALGLIEETPNAGPAPLSLKKSKRTINMIVVHSTATPEGKDVTVDWIRQVHKKKGYSDIGYHYVVYRDGSVHEGRDVNISGAHARGYNVHSIGVVYVGGTDAKGNAKDTRTEAQKAALVALLRRLKALYPKAEILGHRNLNATACPSFDAKKEYKNI